jgi:NADH:ubiquinone oxidoreductase subunit D
MFSYCCSKPNIENVLEKDMDRFRVRIEEMKQQINNIYELLEVLTNESKSKFNLSNNNNVRNTENKN